MKKITKSIVAATLLTTSLNAASFQVLGSKATSMGGAGIATSPSSLASYNNPALLAKNKKTFAFHTGVGVGYRDNGVLDTVSQLDDLNFSDLVELAENTTGLSGVSIDDLTKLNQSKNIILGANNQSFNVAPTVDVAFAIKNFGFGIFANADVAGTSKVDQKYNRLIFKNGTNYYELNSDNSVTVSNQAYYENSSLIYAMDEGIGNTGVQLDGLAVIEIPVAYGHAFGTDFGDIYLGGAFKLMKGTTYSSFHSFSSDKDISDDFDKNKKDSTTVGLDLGVAYNPSFDEDLTLALVGKNLNSPSFDRINGGEFKLDPMVRAGAAYKISFVELAFDVDLTENESINGMKSRYVGGGASFDLFILDLNAGVMKNLSSNDDSGLIYTAGVSMGPVELSAQMASKSTHIDGTKLPKQASVNLAIAFSW
ncbi:MULTISPECIES: conjugal transfer protein TraF [Aliarcobacter]|uniref:conjugal transfer protein TraF n=1 Tax=Aliarcobacter TaxID=2321111 RepID=UPI00242B7957|nr:conjugal transfer protein TraF [Aliarcobacter skirrowii]MDD2507412.1 conjugal transfer protein TraF [Aliarcobacter skirrowii]MDD3495764.1 conjugal transfer protein TraF [Aliarcobacter skirrowii]